MNNTNNTSITDAFKINYEPIIKGKISIRQIISSFRPEIMETTKDFKKILYNNLLKSYKMFINLANEFVFGTKILDIYSNINKKEKNNENIINTSTSANSNTNINKIIEEVNDENEEKRQFLTLEVENPENPVLKKFKTLTQKVMKKYYFIFCVLCLIIAILFTIHLFVYLLSKEVTINIIYNNLYSLNFVNIYWHADC
jgi:hypothetical protein